MLAANLVTDFALPINPVLASVKTASADGQWIGFHSAIVNQQAGEQTVNLGRYGAFDLQESALTNVLANAPLEFTPNYASRAVTISIPRPDLKFDRFSVVESPIMEAGLAAEFPDIKTYRGIGIDDPTALIRFDITMHGFHAQVLTPNGNYYVDPVFKGKTDVYSSYFKSDAIRTGEFHEHGFDELNMIDHDEAEHLNEPLVTTEDPTTDDPQNALPFGNQLRTLRLANAATLEYTNFWGGSVAQGQAAIVTAINRVTGVYERDLAIRLVLVANNSSLVYTSATGDPYSNSNGGAMLGQNQSNVDAVIGNANYDIGHVFSTGGGGVAGLGNIGITGQKARGVTGLPFPSGDPFYIDFVAHEMGHQFGGNHSYNGLAGSCGGQRSSAASYEPGSGTTIMAYAGICGSDNVQNNSDAMFHSISIDEIRNVLLSRPTVGVTTNTGNSIPTVNAGLDYVIPTNTPFELTAVGADADSGNVLTYSWEQRDNGTGATLTAPDNGNNPLFRTWLPTTNPTRVFPRINNLVNNSVPLGERLPTANWSSMDFRVVVRDNSTGGGGVNSDDMRVQVVNVGGSGFSVSSQNTTGINWAGNSSQTITWNVAGTTASPINAANVDIYFSSDGGFTYPTLLASATPNDGSHVITVPNINTSLGRVKVKATGNIFFDINNFNISVAATASTTANLSLPGGLITEGDSGMSTANFVITLTSSPTSTVSVQYASNNIAFANPATPGSDYTNVTGTATFNPGQTTFNIPVTIFGDRFIEGIEQFRVVLFNPSSGLSLGSSSIDASISDDDAFALGKPIDFGTLASPVQVGASGFSTGDYSAAVGVGWTSSSDLASYQMTIGTDLTRDLVYATDGTFRIDIANGTYDVQAIFGIVDFSVERANFPASLANFTVYVEGNAFPLVLPTGSMVTQTFSANVTDGHLDIGIENIVARRQARLSGLMITAAGARSLGVVDQDVDRSITSFGILVPDQGSATNWLSHFNPSTAVTSLHPNDPTEPRVLVGDAAVTRDQGELVARLDMHDDTASADYVSNRLRGQMNRFELAESKILRDEIFSRFEDLVAIEI